MPAITNQKSNLKKTSEWNAHLEINVTAQENDRALN